MSEQTNGISTNSILNCPIEIVESLLNKLSDEDKEKVVSAIWKEYHELGQMR